ncbi:MAG TPA: CPBP family intramembrane glutamic endopeptidase [Dinghuibacter sp.]|uniref:CPBP family intramembrane glutamic endopeptidase n=1 Tax=Dinghuibacter sp. TaxID=2024697 RepID=UPI002CE8A232|nr:CPBP family intramembrane glutamic endopeptidase [Dinghuibacter sp.]HTJ13424.1 CPBP family intramembrane glutamic endopeptidase [Dinghuibacter sp.]
MRPILGDKPLWIQCILLASLLILFMGVMGAVSLLIPAQALQTQAMVESLGFELLVSLTFGALIYSHPFRETGFTPASSHWFYLLAATVVLAAVPVTQVLDQWNQNLHLPHALASTEKWMRDTEASQDKTIDKLLYMPNPGYLIANLFAMALCTAIGEEALFRGVVQKILIRATRNIHVGVWLGAVFFSAMHFQFLGFFPRVVLGLVLGYLYVYSGSLWPSIVAHFVYNGSQVLYFYVHPSSTGGAAIPPLYGLVSTGLVLAGFVWMKNLNSLHGPERRHL